VAAFTAVALVVTETPAQRTVRMPDAASAVLLTAGIGAAVFALVQTPEWGWGDARTIASLVVGLALLAVVVRRSLHHPRPLLELGLVRDRRFGFGNAALLVYSISFFGFLLTSVLFLTDVWDYSIQRAGLLTTPVFVGVALMAVVAGRVAAHIGYRTVLAAGGVLWATGALWMAIGMTSSPSMGRWLGAICTIGLGSGLLWGSMLAVSLSTLPSPSMAAGASLSQTLQNIGNTLGIAIMVTALGEASVGDLGAFPGAWIACAITTVVAVAVCAWGAGTVRVAAHSPAIVSG